MTNSGSSYAAATRSGKLASAGVVIALHGVVLFALLQLAPVRSALTAMAPIMVSMISPPAPEPKVLPKPIPAKPHVERPRPVAKPPVTTAIAASAREVAPAPPPVQLPPTEAPQPIVAAPPAPAPVALAPPAPAPVTPPLFNAEYLNNPAPAYPQLSRRTGEEGRVMLRVLVNERGLPDEVRVRTSSGFPRLDAVALDTVRQWKFVPARRGDTPVSAWVLVPISFSLRS